MLVIGPKLYLDIQVIFHYVNPNSLAPTLGEKACVAGTTSVCECCNRNPGGVEPLMTPPQMNALWSLLLTG